MMIHIGLDLGGTKIAGIALSQNGAVLGHHRIATPQTYPDILKACTDLVAKLNIANDTVQRVGICTPGVIDTDKGVITFSPNVTALKDKPFRDDLSNALNVPVYIANDAACFTLSESRDGAGAGARIVYGVILGTGVGGALVVDQKMPSGPHRANEWGHVAFPFPDKDDVPAMCGCGRVGDIESYLSGPALHRQLAEKLGRAIGNDELLAGINANDAAIMSVMERYATRLAKALAMLITIVDPDVIVLGGGVSNLDIIYKLVPPLIGKYTLSPVVKTKIIKAKHGDDSGLRGAAWL
ncbi:MAG: ROK family protein [Alphaproteobacteria bacterium]|nr:ROK family protein [Alphaproteobacteria bacterium]